MPYYTKVIRPDETVHEVARLHWLIFARGALMLACAVVLLGVLASLPDESTWRLVCAVAAAVFAVIGLLALANAALLRASTEIVVTDKRVIYKRGILRRVTVEMNISKIETVDVIQSITGRLLNYGTLVIRGTGAGIEPLRAVADPLGVRNAILVG